MPQYSGYNQALHALSLADMTSFLCLHFCCFSLFLNSKDFISNLFRVAPQTCLPKSGQSWKFVSFGNGAGFGFIRRYMYIIYEYYENGAKFQSFLTQIVQFGWGNRERPPAGWVRVGKVRLYKYGCFNG